MTKREPLIVKVGGAFLEKEHKATWMDDLIMLQKRGHPVFLVHGAGPFISRAFEEKGIKPKFFEGQRVTEASEVEIVEDVLTRKVNRDLVNLCLKKGGQALGLSGVDGKIFECEPLQKELGQVGKVTAVNSGLLEDLSKHGLVILSPVGYGQGNHFNVNADVAASALAEAFPKSRLVFLTGTDGLLDKEGQVIPEIRDGQIDGLVKDKVITDGMVVKVRMIQAVLKTCKDVAIINGRVKEAISSFIIDKKCQGTLLKA